MAIDEIDHALALRLLQLVRYRLEHPDYLTHDDYGTLLLDSFDRSKRNCRLLCALSSAWVQMMVQATRV